MGWLQEMGTDLHWTAMHGAVSIVRAKALHWAEGLTSVLHLHKYSKSRCRSASGLVNCNTKLFWDTRYGGFVF